jgi:hypothetical protein
MLTVWLRLAQGLVLRTAMIIGKQVRRSYSGQDPVSGKNRAPSSFDTGSPTRALPGRFSRSQRAALKSEARKPKSEGNPKSDGRAGVWTFSVFGLRISFGFRISDFGFWVIPTDFRAPLVPYPSASFHLATRAASPRSSFTEQPFSQPGADCGEVSCWPMRQPG